MILVYQHPPSLIPRDDSSCILGHNTPQIGTQGTPTRSATAYATRSMQSTPFVGARTMWCPFVQHNASQATMPLAP